jgi:hypothetical protein
VTSLPSHSPVAYPANTPGAGSQPPSPPVPGDFSESADPSSPAETEPRTAESSLVVRGDFQVTFYHQGDFAAFNACEAWLKERGFSVGPLQGNSPIGVLLGEGISIGKWKNLSGEDLNDLHAKIMPASISASMKGGPVKVILRSTVHSEVASAFRSDPEDIAARQHVEGKAA